MKLGRKIKIHSTHDEKYTDRGERRDRIYKVHSHHPSSPSTRPCVTHPLQFIAHHTSIYAHRMQNEFQLLDCIHDIPGAVRAREARKPLNLRRSGTGEMREGVSRWVLCEKYSE